MFPQPTGPIPLNHNLHKVEISVNFSGRFLFLILKLEMFSKGFIILSIVHTT